MVDDCHKLGMLPCASRSFFEHARTRTAFRACEENTMPACETFSLLPCCSAVLESRANEAGLSHFEVTPNLPSSLTHAARKLAKCTPIVRDRAVEDGEEFLSTSTGEVNSCEHAVRKLLD